MRVEDPHDPGIDFVRPVVSHRKCFGAPLGFVVAAARPDRIHVAPVTLGLRMDQRVPIDLGRRRQEKRRVLRPREAEHVHRPECADLERVNRVGVVLGRRSRRCEVQDVTNVAADEDAVIDVCLAKLEVRIALEMPQVLRRAGDEVVEGKHPRVTSEQRLAQVRADEARSSRNDRPRFIRGQCRGT